MRRGSHRLLLSPIDLLPQLLYLHLFRPLEALLVLQKLLNRPLVLATLIDPRLKGALDVLLVHERGVGPFFDGLDGLLMGDGAALGGAEGVVVVGAI